MGGDGQSSGPTESHGPSLTDRMAETLQDIDEAANSGGLTVMGDFQEAPGVPEVQGVLGGLLGLLRRPGLPGLPDRRRRDHLYRPLPPPDLQALQGPETNRSRPS